MENYANKYDAVLDIYDQYASVDFDIPFWVMEGTKAGEVLELTAGTGRITLPLVKAGVKVTALDISHALLNILMNKAKQEGLDIEVVRADIRTFQLDRKYPLIILPFHSIQELISRRDQLDALEHVSEHLQDNGYFIVSIHNPKCKDAIPGKNPLSEFRDSKTGHIVKFFNNRTVKDQIATNEQIYKEFDGNRIISERKFINRSYVFHEGEFEDLLNEAGFRTDHVWGGYKYEIPADNSRFLIYRLAKK